MCAQLDSVNTVQSAPIAARRPWNHTGVRLEAGATYEFVATGTWTDRDHESDADGYVSPNFLMKLAELGKRVRAANWLALIGSVDEDESLQFVIGTRSSHTVKR